MKRKPEDDVLLTLNGHVVKEGILKDVTEDLDSLERASIKQTKMAWRKKGLAA